MTGSDLSSSGGASRPEPPKGAAGQAVRGALGHAVVLAFLGYFFLPAYVPFNTTAVLAAGLGLKLQQTDVPRFLAAVGAVLGVVTGGIGGWTARSRSLRRNAEVQSVAAGIGGTYTAQSGAELGSWLRPFFANASFVEVTNLVRLDDERVWVADAHVKYHRSRGSTLNTRPAQPSDQTVAWLDAGELALPGFTLQPEGFLVNALSRAVGVEDIDFSSQTEFSGKYHLSAVHAENTRRLFDSSLLAVLARTNGLHMQCRRDGLVLYRPKQVVDSADFKAFTTEALTILRLVKQSAASLAATGPLAAATGTDVNALAKNMPGDDGQARSCPPGGTGRRGGVAATGATEEGSRQYPQTGRRRRRFWQHVRVYPAHLGCGQHVHHLESATCRRGITGQSLHVHRRHSVRDPWRVDSL